MLYVITGGSGSGKSEYAERRLSETGDLKKIYLATMMVWDEEGKRRVKRHRLMRKEKGFETVERYNDLEHFEVFKPEAGVSKKPSVLLECMSNLVSNEYCRLGISSAESVIRGIKSLQNQSENLIIVTNEVFSDGGNYSRETLNYIEWLGRVNRYLGQAADSVTEVLYGIPIKIK